MNFGDVLAQLDAFYKRVQPQLRSIYSKLEVREPVRPEELESLRDTFGFEPDPGLLATWAITSALTFEWFVKSEGARLAGIDTRLAPSGQFSLLSPAQAAREMEFLSELAGVTDDEMQLIPFAKLQPNGELIAVDHSRGERAIVLVILDLVLSVIPLAENIEAWYAQRIRTYFEDSTIDPSTEPSPALRATLKCLNQPTVDWPPAKQGW